MVNGTQVTRKLSSNVACDSNDENNFLKVFKSSNTQLSKMVQLEDFLVNYHVLYQKHCLKQEQKKH